MGLNRFKKIAALLSLSISLLTGCGSKLSTGNFDIKLTDGVPVAYLNESYDLKKILTISEGINYEITASYYNYDTKKMTDIPVNDYHFTPISLSDVAIVIKAHNATYIKVKKTSVRVKVKGDPLDELLSVGASNYCDPGMSKQLNISSQFIKVAGNSSILCSYYGNNPYTWGGAIICPNNFRCLNYFSDKTWNNAILTFWVFNPTDYRFEFQLRLQQIDASGQILVDTDWGNPLNVPQFAEPGVWTQVFFSMNKLGVNKPLIVTEDGTQHDSLNIKTKWAGDPGTGESYNWQMYVDGLDVVDASVYPQIDTEKDSSSEVLKDGWENLPLDTGETSCWGRSKSLYRSTVVRKIDYESKSSLYLTFANTTPALDVGYSVAFSPEQQHELDKSFTLPAFNKGKLQADIKFSENISDHSINFYTTNMDWDVKSIKNLNVTNLGDGWHRLSLDFSEISEFASINAAIRFVFQFNGINDGNKSTAKIYIDNVFYSQSA